MTNEQIIQNAIDYITKLFETNSGGHDAAHTLRVYRNACLLAEAEGAKDTLVIALAALLHDVDDYKLFATENLANARAFLRENEISEEMTEQICTVIEGVSFHTHKKPDSLAGMIVQDADRLDAIGAVGIGRTFAFGGEHGRSMESSIQHFYDKLLLLKDLLNTDAARAIAQRRHAFMETFLAEWYEEIGEM